MAEWITARAAELSQLSVFADCFAADLYPLAMLLEPLHAHDGDVLMCQGEAAQFFLIIGAGGVVVVHTNADGGTVETTVDAGQVIGEIALLRHAPRVATVRAAGEVTGWSGGDEAFDRMIELPGVLAMLVRTARQRLAAFITPIPVRLADGTELLLRPVLPGDDQRSSNAAVEFSTETIYRRFMSTRAPSPALMHYLFEVDYVDHFVWVLVDGADGPVVADVRFVRSEDDADSAEIAFIVADDYQGRGIGSFLMEALIIAAHVGGVRRFTARLLAENGPMRSILDRFGAHFERDEPGVIATEFDVPAVDGLAIEPAVADRIRSVARQVMRAVG